MLHLIFRFVFQIVKAQRTGVEGVFVFVRRRGNHRAVKLCVFADRNLKALFSGKNTRLVLY
ncbi:hypothetical protein AB7038_17995 [Morganella morganii]|uniref:hypothetical protein n=1 Tax=Morganella morganii TaxID=582 RepID=UPI0034E38097